MNKFIGIGRLTRDPEIRSAGDTKVASFSVAFDRRVKGKDGVEADFLNFTAFGKLAEFVEKWLTKGIKVAVEGRAQNHNYTDKNGVKRYEVQFVADQIEFVESKGAGTAANQGAKPVAQDDSFIAAPDDVDEGELPFN